MAGISAAVALAERGVRVVLVEAAQTLGGRLGAWPHTLPDGTHQVVEHGFHAFFRHYYTWRSILRRIDPDLGFLAPVNGYPVTSRSWPDEDLTGLPAAPPFNLLALLLRSPSLSWRDMTGADPDAGQALLAYDRVDTPTRFDHMSAEHFLKQLGMSERAQQMLFEAFARSFFSDPGELSAGELIAMFHYYFLGNPEGIGFDAPTTDHMTAIWNPLRRYLQERGAEVRTGVPGGPTRPRRSALAADPRRERACRGPREPPRRARPRPGRAAAPARRIARRRRGRAPLGEPVRGVARRAAVRGQQAVVRPRRRRRAGRRSPRSRANRRSTRSPSTPGWNGPPRSGRSAPAARSSSSTPMPARPRTRRPPPRGCGRSSRVCGPRRARCTPSTSTNGVRRPHRRSPRAARAPGPECGPTPAASG